MYTIINVHCFFPPHTDTQENANRIARSVLVEYESLGRPIVTTEDGIRANSYIDNIEPSEVKVGDAQGESSTTL